MAAMHTMSRLRRAVQEWAQHHNITLYKLQPSVAYTAVLEFNDPAHYTLFALTWTQSDSWLKHWVLEKGLQP